MRFNDLHFASEILQDEKLDYAGGISFFFVLFSFKTTLSGEYQTKALCCLFVCKNLKGPEGCIRQLDCI